MTFAKRALQFYSKLELSCKLPYSVEVLQPYKSKEVIRLCELFLTKYYHDHDKRKLIMGINPGRLGGGITGISFTDPVQLQHACGIASELPQKAELSSTFIYKMIETCGGVEYFYKQYFISAVCPLGFVKDGKNLNYYDLPELQMTLEPFIIESIKTQIGFGVDTSVGYCLGEGKNFDYLMRLNKEHKFFNKIEPLPHPRFIMQYKRKELAAYLADYKMKLR